MKPLVILAAIEMIHSAGGDERPLFVEHFKYFVVFLSKIFHCKILPCSFYLFLHCFQLEAVVQKPHQDLRQGVILFFHFAT